MSKHNHKAHKNNIFIAMILNIIITLSQIIGGIVSGSLALLSDALHNFSDVIALVIAWWANKIAERQFTETRTYGYKRAEILATLFNASALIGVGLYLIVEAVQKFFHPEPINSTIVIYLGLLSIVLNSASVLLIKNDHHRNMNIKAAYLHLLTDVMTSISVVIGGLLMSRFKLFLIDPLISVIIALYLISASTGLIKDAAAILMQFTPTNIDIQTLKNTIVNFSSEIKNLHHLHLWQLDEHNIHFEAHLDYNKNLTLKEANAITASIEKLLLKNFGINHCTFQSEYNVDDNKQLIQKPVNND